MDEVELNHYKINYNRRKHYLRVVCRCNNWSSLDLVIFKLIGSSARCPVMTLMGEMQVKWEGGPRGRDICVPIADSLHCTAESNTHFKELSLNKK